MLLNALAIVVLGGLWMLWDHHRHRDEPVDEELKEREARFGARLVLAWVWVLAVLAVGLILDGVGVRGAGWLALAAVTAMMVLFYVVPLFAPRRSRRSGEQS